MENRKDWEHRFSEKLTELFISENFRFKSEISKHGLMVDFVIFAVFAKYLGFNYLIVGAVGFILATTINYFMSVRHVFESGVRFSFHKEFLLVFVVSLVGLILNQIVLLAGIGWLGWEMLFVKVCATGSVFFWNFSARSQFIFKPLNQGKASS